MDATRPTLDASPPLALPRRDPLVGLRDRPVILALVLIAAIAAAVIVALGTPTTYRAEADVLVSPVDAESEQLEGLGLLQGARGSVVAAARLVESESVTQIVRRRLGLGPGEPAPVDEIDVTPLPQSDLIAIEATTESPERSARVANVFANSLLAQRKRAFQRKLRREIARVQRLVTSLEAPLGTADHETLEVLRKKLRTLEAFRGAPDPTLGVFERATVPDEPRERPTLRIAATFLSVLLVGIGLVLALAGLTPRVLSELDLPRGVPVLARVPRPRSWFGRRAEAQPAELAEPFRTLRIRLAAGRVDGRLPRVIVITSPRGRDGKTEFAIGLGRAIAATGNRVLLVDADLGARRREGELGVHARERGFATLLDGDGLPVEPLIEDLDDRWPGLRMLPAGGGDGHHLVDPVAADAVTARLLEHADVVIFEAPAMTRYADALALAHSADAVLVTLRFGGTRRAQLERALDVFATVGIEVTGLVAALRTGLPRARRGLL